MFEIGLTELAMVALVALLVLGPEKLPRAARMAGLYLRKARATWFAIRTDIERELAAEDMKRALRETEQSILSPLDGKADDNTATSPAETGADSATPDAGLPPTGELVETAPDPEPSDKS